MPAASSVVGVCAGPRDGIPLGSRISPFARIRLQVTGEPDRGRGVRARKSLWRGLFVVLCLLGCVLVLGSFVPGPIEGVWYPRILDCMCDSRNLVEFKNGVAVLSSDHNEENARGPRGVYSKENGVWVWRIPGKARERVIELYPTWFFIRVVSRASGERYWGYRIMRPPQSVMHDQNKR